jgi:hypothetical protein
MAYFRCIGGSGSAAQALDINSVIGSSGIAISEGKFLSGFTNASEGYYPRTSSGTVPTLNMSNAWKIHFRVKASQEDSNGYQSVYGAKSGYYKYPLLEFQKPTSSNIFWAGWSLNGSSNAVSLSIPKSQIPFVADRWYTIDEEWDGTNTASLKVSDGTNTYTAQQTTSAFYQDSGAEIALGARASADVAKYVTYDLSDCYCEQGGVIIWGNKS